MSKEKQILQLHADKLSQRKIAVQLHVSRNTVSSVISAAQREHLDPVQIAQLDDHDLYLKLFPEKAYIPVQVEPDYDYIHKELLRDGVTLRILWEEYVDQCRDAQKPPYMYSQFCKKYSDFVDSNHLTMHIQHKPGDKLMVDWAGTKLQIYDRVTNETCNCYLFVATLPFSMYCYAEACMTMKEPDWINAHIHMFQFFGGSTKLLVCDNLKTGVLKNKKHEDPVLNRSYRELADHYGTALLPARVLAPKDKAAVEGTVGQLTTHIIGKLRNRRFFSLSELNEAVRQLLYDFNHREFQKREGSRWSVWKEEELFFMQKLPSMPYEFAEWKKATVQMNYHVQVDYQYYSVPYEYAKTDKKHVEVRMTRNLVEVYSNGNRICSHRRVYGRRGQYMTNPEHMPPNHQLYSEWNRERFQRWASGIGPSTRSVVDRIFDSYRVEEQAYKGCLSLLKLADKYSAERLENACGIALEHIPSPRYKNIRLILEAGQDKAKNREHEEPSSERIESVKQNTHLRGAAYYGGGHHHE